MHSSEMVCEARVLAKQIAGELIIEHPGEYIRKGEIRVKYNIAWSKASNVFIILQDYGFEVSRLDVLVPVSSGLAS